MNNLKSPSSILVIRTSSIGDIVLIAPFFSGLKKLYPKTQISWLVKKDYAEILSEHPAIDRTIIWDKDKESIFQLIKRLKKDKFDLIIDLHSVLNSYIISFLLKKDSKIIRCKKYHFARLLLVIFKIKPKGDASLSVRERYLKLLRNLGLINFNNLSCFEIKSSILKKTERLLPKNFKNFIVICDEATAPTKRWDKFYNLTERLLQKNRNVVLIGKEDTNEYFLLERLYPENLCNLKGKTSIMESAAIIKKSLALICNDTGMMHIGDALGIRTITIWGPTVKEFGFYPYNKKTTVLELSLKCRPCSLHGSKRCPLGHFKCMKDISVNDVLRQIETTVKK